MKDFRLIVAGTLALLITSCGNKNEKSEESIATVKVETVKGSEQDNLLQYPGKVVSSTDASLSFKVAGTLKKVYVDEGDYVSAGQLIAILDDSDYRVQLNATKAEYAQIKADAERVIGLYKEGGTTASNYDKARYGLQQIEAKLQNHTNQLTYTRLYAPFSGYVDTKFFSSNETVGAGMPVVSIMGSGALEVEVNLPASSYVHRSTFCSYSCSLDVLPGEVIPLKMVSIMPQANSNQLYTMRLRIGKADSRIAPGMSAWVTINNCDSTSTEVSVPATSLLHKDGHHYIFLYNGQSRSVKQVEVSVLKLHTDGTAVILGDVNVGDQVVSTGVHHISDGVKVELLEPVSKTNVGGLL